MLGDSYHYHIKLEMTKRENPGYGRETNYS